MEHINEILRGFGSSLASAKMYSVNHPQVQETIDITYTYLKKFFEKHEELIIGVVENELIFENQILFNLSLMLLDFIKYLKNKNIEKIYIYPNLKKDELAKFLAMLLMKKNEIIGTVQEYLARQDIINIKVGILTVPEEQKKIEGLTSIKIYENMLNDIAPIFDKIIQRSPLAPNAHSDLKLILSNAMQNLSGKHQENLEFVPSNKQGKIFAHSLNVALLGMQMSSQLGFAPNDVLDVGVAGLFHDIGRLFLLQPKIPIGDSLENHFTVGAQILLRYENDLGVLPIIVCFEHHQKYNGRVKESSSPERKLHLVSRIISLCDFYDMLNKRRDVRHDYPADKIFELMSKEKNRLFHPGLLEEFFRILGVWPVGTIVSLSDGCIAIVREENHDDIFFPKVEIVSPIVEQKFVDLREKKSKIKILQTLSPMGAGKKYKYLI